MEIPSEWIIGFGLVLVRTSALVVTAPILGLSTGFAGHKIALIFGLSVITFLAVRPEIGGDPDVVLLSLMAFREVVIGAFLSFFLQLILMAVRVAGALISQEMGLLTARQADPATGVRSTLITSIYENFFVLALLLMNGHLWLIRGLSESFQRAPIGEIALGGDIPLTIQAMFTEMFGAGIVFAAPILIFLSIVSSMIGLLARAIPTLNVMEIGFSIRVSTSLCAMYFFAPLLEPSMLKLNGHFLEWLDRGLDALG